MKARHKFLQQNHKYQDKVPELATYNQLAQTSNLLVFTMVTGIAVKFTKYKFVKNNVYNVGLFCLFPLVAIVGHWENEQSKLAEVQLQELLSNEFKEKQ